MKVVRVHSIQNLIQKYEAQIRRWTHDRQEYEHTYGRYPQNNSLSALIWDNRMKILALASLQEHIIDTEETQKED